MPMDFAQTYGKMAVIAGGSEGVGAAYARLLASRGIDLALIARKPGTLEETASALRQEFPAREILTLSADLTDPQSADQICALTGDREVGLLIYNAGAGNSTADFLETPLAVAQKLTALNVTAPMALIHHYGKPMKSRGRGGIVLLGSFAGFVGNPQLAVYSAAKAFSATFAEALWLELKPHGVHVLGHTLGSTNTPAVARDFPQMAGLGADPKDVAATGLANLANGPILRAEGGNEFIKMLDPVDRAAAVEAAWAAGAPYRA
jgi:short-subunit dehydrogenase